MCTAKEDGGLGFRILNTFNIAMLAEQGWRLLSNDNPFVTNLMKARYFPNNDFLEATLGANPSYMWRSILESQEVLRQGVRKRIGDGLSTNIWKVPWLPCKHNGFLTSTCHTQLADVQVRNLMEDGSNRWDEEVLRVILNERDVQLIQIILIPMVTTSDSWFWLSDESGKLKVKSCYRNLQGEQVWSNAGFWRKLWSLDLPGIVINFMWRMCRACLPTAVNLIQKKVQVSPMCSWCLCHQKTVTHVLFQCSFAQAVWENLGMVDIIPVEGDQELFSKMQLLFTICTKEKLLCIAMVC